MKTSLVCRIPNCILISGGPIIVQVRANLNKYLEIFIELILKKSTVTLWVEMIGIRLSLHVK